MIRLITFPLLFLLALTVQAQKVDYAFEGLINTQLKVRLRFSLEEGKANGYCIYIDSKAKKALEGTMTEDGTLVLHQKDGESFKGKIIANYMLKGEIYSAENVDQGTFLLSKIESPIEEDEQLLVGKTETSSKDVKSATTTLSEVEIDDILRKKIKEFQECNQKGIDPMKCKQYTARAITEIYNLDDFKDQYVGGSYLTMTEAYDKISSDSHWKMIGELTSADKIQKAMDLANEGNLVIIAYPFKGFTQLAVVRKGKGTSSSKWGGKVPEVAIFFNSDPSKSAERKGLNYLWRSGENMEIWVKN